MCMGIHLSEAEKQEYIKKHRKHGSIVVWKVVEWDAEGYRSEFYSHFVRRGYYADVCSRNGHAEGVHAFQNPSSARRWRDTGGRIIQCRIKPKWLIDIGEDDIEGEDVQTLTAEHMVFPEYPKRTVSHYRFRKVCKEHGL